jgi:alkaline phosphatase D
VGRTRTLPEGPTASFRLAVFSCANYGFGWFNAYAHAAAANDADLAVHLGDYIYEYEAGKYPDKSQARSPIIACAMPPTAPIPISSASTRCCR